MWLPPRWPARSSRGDPGGRIPLEQSQGDEAVLQPTAYQNVVEFDVFFSHLSQNFF